MGNVRMRADQINYGATNVKVALDDLDPKDLIALSERMDKIEAWQDTVEETTVSGAEAVFTNALALPAKSLITSIEAIQDLHGYDHPWAGGAGANKWDEQWELGYYNVTTGQYLTRADGICSKHDSPIPVLPSTQYTFVCPYAGVEIVSAILYYDSNDDYISWDSVKTGSTGAYRGFVTPANAAYVRFYLHDSYGTAYQNNIAVNYPATAQTYSPYSNICPISGRTAVTITDVDAESQTATVTVQLGQTVYGGTLNVTTGVLTIDHALVDLGSLNWIKQDDTVGYVVFTQANPALERAANYNFICSQYKTAQKIRSELLNGEIGTSNVAMTNVCIRDDSKESLTAEQFKTAMSGVQLCYELATPTTVQLTPTQLTMLKGYNRLSSDGGGDIEVTAYTGAAWGGDEA